MVARDRVQKPRAGPDSRVNVEDESGMGLLPTVLPQTAALLTASDDFLSNFLFFISFFFFFLNSDTVKTTQMMCLIELSRHST